MSKLTDDLDLSFVLGTGDLIQVAFTLYQVILRFERLTVEIFRKCEIVSPSGEHWLWKAEHVSDMTGFAKILESKIQTYDILPNQKLILTFSNRYHLVLYGDESGYESFVMDADGKNIVVH
jgi:hypothetical protein